MCNSDLLIVGTGVGADEARRNNNNQLLYMGVVDNFDKKTAYFLKRVQQHEGTSYQFF